MASFVNTVTNLSTETREFVDEMSFYQLFKEDLYHGDSKLVNGKNKHNMFVFCSQHDKRGFLWVV